MPPDNELIDQLADSARSLASTHALYNAAQPVDPPQARRLSELQRRTGYPTSHLGKDDLAIVETRDRALEAARAAATSPRVAAILAQPAMYAKMADGMHALSAMAAAADRNRRLTPVEAARWEERYGVLRAPQAPRPTVANFFRGVWESFRGGGQQTSASLGIIAHDLGIRAPQQAVARYRTPDSILPEQRRFERAGDNVESATPTFRSWYMRGAYSGVSSLAQIAPALAVSIALRNPAPAIAVGGGTVGTQAYGKYRSRGASPGTAAVGGIAEGGVEAATELIPMRWLVGRFGRVGFGEFMAGLLGREVPSELVATIAQNATDTAIANPDKTWGEYVRELPDDLVQTAAATVTQALLLGGPAHIAQRRARGLLDEEAMKNVDAVMEAATEHPARTEAPEDFRDVVNQLTEGAPGENLFIPAEAVRSLFQSPEDLSSDSFWGGYAGQIEEAEALGGDVVVPLAEAATHLAGTPQWEQLRDRVRATPGGLSRAEAAEDKGEEARAAGEAVAAEMQAAQEAAGPVQRIYEQMRDKLTGSGYRPEAADKLAAMFSQRQATRAQRLGKTLSGEEAATVEIRSDIQEGRTLLQSYMEGSRGKITFTTDGQAIIDLTEKRDLSTFIHESGHLFLEEMKADATEALKLDTPEGRQLFADWEAIKAWMGKEGHVLENGEIPTDAHELFARAFERYTMEGKAPSSALRRAFEAFRSWLLTIYKHVSNLRAEITPEIRDVMARMLATDEEIAAAAEEQNIRPLFKTPAEAGMTRAEFDAYERSAQRARDEAHDALLYRTMAAVRRQRESAYRAEQENVRAEVTQETDAQPIHRALKLLRTGRLGDEEAGRVKLDRKALVEAYGEDIIDQLPRSVPPIYADTETTDADIVAERTGFESGDALIRALVDHETVRRGLRERGDKRSPRQAMIGEETAQRMAERHGDPLRDGSIEEEARALIHNDRQGEVIASELRALARQRRPGSSPDRGNLLPYQVARRWAAEKIRTGKVSEVASGAALQQYERGARQAAKLAEQAILKGDAEEAFKQKRHQLLNNALISEARKSKDAIEVAVRRLGKTARKRTMPSVDQDYLEQAHQLLEQVELRPRSQRDIDRQESFEAWAAQQRAQGRDIAVPDSFAASIGLTHWSRLTVEQLVGLDETVRQILHLGRLKQTLLDGRERRAFDEVVAEGLAAPGKLPPKAPSDLMEPGFADRLKSGVAGIDAALLKLEQVFDWLDGGDTAGVFNRVAFRPIADAQGRENEMLADYYGRIREAMSKVPKERISLWTSRVTTPELINRDTGNPFTFTRQQLVALALNMGNEGNIQRVTDGYGWSEANVLRVLDRELSKEEWAFVQETWDIIDTLWPHIAELERRVNGLEPEKVEARPLETSAGRLRGGYYPVIYDTSRSPEAERDAARSGDLFEATYTRATTRAGASNERVQKVVRPVLLQLGVINRHLGEVIHDVTHREAVLNAEKFLADPRIVRAVDETLGPEIRKQFRPWLKFVANSWAMERSGNEGIGKFINKARANATIVGMGWRITTILTQFAGYSNSFEYVGARWVTPAIAQVSRRPIESFNFVMSRSAEIKHRMDTLDRDIRISIRQMAGKHSRIAAAKRFAFHGIGYADRIVVIPTWIGAYNKALASGAEEAHAIYAADKAVRLSQGAGSPKDLAAVQRGTGKWGVILQLSTMFYSYLSAFYQRERTLGRDISSAVRERDIRATPALMARAWWLIVVPPVLAEILAGRGPDDGDDWGEWAAKKIVVQMLGPIPFVRDLIEPIWSGLIGGDVYDYKMSPLQSAGQSFVQAAEDIGTEIHGGDAKRPTRHVLEAAGYATGLVPGQLAAATQFLVDVGQGEQDPQTLADWYTGLSKGKLPE